jgi:hypothetical protein
MGRWANIGSSVGGEASSGSGPGSGAGAGLGAGTGSGADASMGVGTGSVVGDGAEAESMKAGSARAERVGDIGSADGAGGPVVGEAVKGPSITRGTSGNVATDGVVEAQGDNGERGGGVSDGSIAGLDMGERRSSPSFGPRSNSALFCRLLAFFAGGVFTSIGQGGGGAVGGGGAAFDRRTFSQAGAATSDEGGSGQTGLSLAVVAARPRG